MNRQLCIILFTRSSILSYFLGTIYIARVARFMDKRDLGTLTLPEFVWSERKLICHCTFKRTKFHRYLRLVCSIISLVVFFRTASLELLCPSLVLVFTDKMVLEKEKNWSDRVCRQQFFSGAKGIR